MGVTASIYRPIAIMTAFSAGAMFFLPMLLGTLVLALDTRSRFLDYRRFKTRPFSKKLANELGKSWCGRGVAEAIWPAAKPYYKSQGYSFFHILPDGFPWVFFDIRFVKSILGIGK